MSVALKAGRTTPAPWAPMLRSVRKSESRRLASIAGMVRLFYSTMQKPLLALLLVLACGTLQAQGYPNKPVRVVVGYAPGGAADAGIRPLARVLEPLLGQPLIIENKPGNAGGVAMEFIAKAPADGY